MTNNKKQSAHHIHDVKLPKDKKSLEKIANSVSNPITIYEGGIFIPAALFILSITSLITAYENYQKGQTLFMVFFSVIAIFLFLLLIKTIIRRRLPFMILTKEGLECSVFKTPLLWRGILDFQINSSKNNVMNIAVGMEFLIHDQFLPKQNEKCRSGSYYDEKKKKLMISGFNFQLNTNRDTIIEQLTTYRNAAIAEYMLEKENNIKK